MVGESCTLLKARFQGVFYIVDFPLSRSPLHLRQAFPEISTQQDVEKRVNAAAGIAETDREVIAHIESQSGLLHLQVHQLYHMIGGSTQDKHCHQHQHHLCQLHHSLPGNTGVVAIKETLGWNINDLRNYRAMISQNFLDNS